MFLVLLRVPQPAAAGQVTRTTKQLPRVAVARPVGRQFCGRQRDVGMVSRGGRGGRQLPLGMRVEVVDEIAPDRWPDRIRIQIVSSGISGTRGPKRRRVRSNFALGFSRRNASASNDMRLMMMMMRMTMMRRPQKIPLLICHVEGRTEQSRSRGRHPVPVLLRHRVQMPERIFFAIAPPKWQHLPSGGPHLCSLFLPRAVGGPGAGLIVILSEGPPEGPRTASRWPPVAPQELSSNLLSADWTLHLALAGMLHRCGRGDHLGFLFSGCAAAVYSARGSRGIRAGFDLSYEDRRARRISAVARID